MSTLGPFFIFASFCVFDYWGVVLPVILSHLHGAQEEPQRPHSPADTWPTRGVRRYELDSLGSVPPVERK